MRTIPTKMRSQLEALPRMKWCTLHRQMSTYGYCEGRIEWHHVWTYSGKQINEPWAILGACHRHHEMVKQITTVREAFEAESFKLATPEDLAEYPKKNWGQIIKHLTASL